MGLDVKDALNDKDIAKVYEMHQITTNQELNLSKLSNFDKLFTLYNINLMDKNILNLEEIDKQSQYAYLTEQKKLTVEKIQEIQDKVVLD